MAGARNDGHRGRVRLLECEKGTRISGNLLAAEAPIVANHSNKLAS
jgi:hypothetical protein